MVSVSFTATEDRVDLVLGLSFTIVALIAGYRCLNSWVASGSGRKVISLFNTLLFLASAARAVWFLIPDRILEPSYVPLPEKIKSHGSLPILLSEILLSVGTFFLYGVFILIACYWYTMLRKIDSDRPVDTLGGTAAAPKPWSALQLFYPIMALTLAIQSINIICYYRGWFDTEQMVAYDGATLAVVACAVLAVVIYLSRKINRVLRNMEIINQSSSRAQIRRIESVVHLAQFFFATRIILEVAMYVWLTDFPHIFLGQGAVSDENIWIAYIAVKHSLEILVLVCELSVSNAIRSYDNRRTTFNSSLTTPTYTGLMPAPNLLWRNQESVPQATGSGHVELYDRRPNYGSTMQYNYQSIAAVPFDGSGVRYPPVVAEQPYSSYDGKRRVGQRPNRDVLTTGEDQQGLLNSL